VADLFRFADEFGPAKIVHIHEPGAGLRAVVVIDNTACGPAMGGVRMAPDVSAEEAVRLARAMTMKNALAGIPYGGGKAVIFADPAIDDTRKERLMRAFAGAIRDFTDYIPGPDMGTNEQCMAWVHDEIGRAIGLPAAIGGIPLDEIGATGFGVAAAAEVASRYCQLNLSGARVVVQGFGAVGTHAAKLLGEKGARLVGVADISGALHDDDGIDIASLIAHVRGGGVVKEFANGATLPRDAVIDIASDIFIPAARPDVLTADNVDRLKTRLIVQGANIPISDEAEATLHRRGVLSVPDFVANAGGIICGAVEYQGGTQDQALQRIDQSIRANTEAVLERSAEEGITPRAAGLAIAQARVRAAMANRRWS
jgi:glutamate dehydrogenase/leucine dehydrogenase